MRVRRLAGRPVAVSFGAAPGTARRRAMFWQKLRGQQSIGASGARAYVAGAYDAGPWPATQVEPRRRGR